MATSADDTAARLAAAQSRAQAAAATRAASGARRGPLVGVLVIGVGLIAAPFIFQMLAFDNRAPKGGEMIDEFRPFMTSARLSKFDGFMDVIDKGEAEARAKLIPAVEAAPKNPAQENALRSVKDWSGRWPGEDGIFADMTNLLDDVRANVDNFAAVDALPPFPLFPFFFLMPGLIIAGLAYSALRKVRAGQSAGGVLTALIVMGVGLIAAPFIFQMAGGENRAFEGNGMINDFKPIMTTEKVTTIQNYFPIIGLAEGQMRNELVPLAQRGGQSFPAIASFNQQWPAIGSEFAQFLGAMSDNVDNFAAVKALPPFALFPFFFILPGLLVAGLVISARRGARAPA